MDKIQAHKAICEELNKIYAKKNSDYGNSFGETFDKLGIISAVTRISDKYNRLASLCTKPEEERKVKDESITDTLLDMANYCIMTVIEMNKDTTEDAVENNRCNHMWAYEGRVQSMNECKEVHRCIICGETKRVDVKEIV